MCPLISYDVTLTSCTMITVYMCLSAFLRKHNFIDITRIISQTCTYTLYTPLDLLYICT